MQGTKIKVTISGDGTVSVEHGCGTQVIAAVSTPDPDDPREGGPWPSEVAWNSGKYVTVKGPGGSMQIVTCIPSSSGPAPDNSPAPTFAS